MTAYSDIFQGLPGYWSRGKFYPAIMGGSDAATSAAAMIGSSGESGGTESSGVGSQGGTGSQESSDNSFAREILDSLDVSDKSERAVLEKYLSGIDSQVNNRFQSIHDQYAPFKDMDPDNVQNAMGIMQMIEHNPQQVIEIISQALGEEGEEGEYSEEGEEGEEYDDEEGEYSDLDPEFMERFEYVEELLEKLAEIVVENQRTTTESQEDAELEEEISSLKEAHGDFNEEWVLSYAAGAEVPLEDAVKSYMGLVQSVGGQQKNSGSPPSGPMLSGNGTPPNELVDPKELSNKDTKNLVAQILSASSLEE